MTETGGGSTSAPFVRLHDGKLAPAPDKFGTKGEVYGATFTIGTEGNDTANVISVTVQLTDYFGINMAVPNTLVCFISNDATGLSTGTAHSTSPVIGTTGVLKLLITDVCWLLTSTALGLFSLDFEDNGTQTVYLVLCMPDGRHVVSDAITHAA